MEKICRNSNKNCEILNCAHRISHVPDLSCYMTCHQTDKKTTCISVSKFRELKLHKIDENAKML